MKVIPFQIPKDAEEAFRVQVDELPVLYPHLHQHPELQLTWVEKGHGTLVAGDFVGGFEPGDVLLIGANQPHVFRSASPSRTVSIFFDRDTLGAGFWQLKELSGLQWFWRQSGKGFRVIGAKRESVARVLAALPLISGIQKISAFLEIMKLLSVRKDLSALSSHVENKNIRDYDGDRLNRVMAYSFENFSEQITLGQISSIASLTPEAFCKYFKTRTRKTYTAFLQELRISHACKLLETTEMTVSAVALECGFGNLSHFNRVFRKVMGRSPRGKEVRERRISGVAQVIINN